MGAIQRLLGYFLEVAVKQDYIIGMEIIPVSWIQTAAMVAIAGVLTIMLFLNNLK